MRRQAARGFDIKYLHRDGSHGLQGRRARRGPEGRARRVHRDLRRGLRAAAGFPARAPCRYFADDEARASSRRAGAISTRTTRCSRACRRCCSTATSCSSTAARNRSGCFFNFNGTAGVWRRDGDRRRRRLAARHADRGSRPQLSRAAARLAVPVPAGSRDAGRSARRDERLQVAAASLGEGLHPDVPQAAAVHPAVGSAAQGEGRGVLPPHGELQLPADDRALDPDVPGDGRPLRDGLDGDAADRRAAVRGGDVLGVQLLSDQPARDLPGLADAREVPADRHGGRHRPRRQQHARR